MNLKITEQKRVSRPDIAFCLIREEGTRRVFFGSSDAKIHTLDLTDEKPEDGAFESDQGHQSYITGLAMARPGVLVSGSYDRQLAWWDCKKRSLIRKLPAHEKWIRKVVSSPNGKLIASVADDMVCRLWNSTTGELHAELSGHAPITPHDFPSMLYTCAFSPDGQVLATADKTGQIVIWDIASKKQITTLEAPIMYTWDPRARRHSIGGIRSLAFSPDGKSLAVGGMGKVGNIDHLGGQARIEVFNWEKQESIAAIETGSVKGLIQCLAFHPDGNWLLGCGGDGKGCAVLIDPAKWEIAVELQTQYHIHDFLLNESSDEIFAAGHQSIGTLGIEAV